MNYQAFYAGDSFTDYEYLGCHYTENGAVFRTFAPNAKSIQLIGEFNNWQGDEMVKVYDGNFWELIVENAIPGMMYKYRIEASSGKLLDHCDPYGFEMEKRPKSASIVTDSRAYTFTDDSWMKSRSDMKPLPLNIYELHFGSWKRKSDEPEDWYSYAEMAELIIPYLLESGYNCLEIMPLSEHPCDESWGYQNTGFFSPTSRYGSPEQLKYFVNECHKNGICVILDFVPVHFAVDDYALWNYDGTPLYEYPPKDIGTSEWGSCNFMHSRGEVRSFLQSAANYWLSEFHFDGLRMDAISNLIYWQGNPARGENRDAIEFLRKMNAGLKELHPSAILAAEDSTSRKGITAPVKSGGLGFDYKWDLGWMNDTLAYFKLPPEHRKSASGMLGFSMHYFYDECFILPLSHDEVVHGKASILQKMEGDYDKKFSQAKSMYLYMYAHPGKKLNFMGNEIGQFREWDEGREQDWNLLSYPVHKEFFEYIKELNFIYLKNSALFSRDYLKGGFEWRTSSSEPCTFAFERKSDQQRILCLFNFSEKEIDDFAVELYRTKELHELISSETDPSVPRIDKAGNCHVSMPAYSGKLFLIDEK